MRACADTEAVQRGEISRDILVEAAGRSGGDKGRGVGRAARRESGAVPERLRTVRQSDVFAGGPEHPGPDSEGVKSSDVRRSIAIERAGRTGSDDGRRIGRAARYEGDAAPESLRAVSQNDIVARGPARPCPEPEGVESSDVRRGVLVKAAGCAGGDGGREIEGPPRQEADAAPECLCSVRQDDVFARGPTRP